MTPEYRIEGPAAPDELVEPLAFIEEFLREGEFVPSSFAGLLARAVERGDMEVLVARSEGRVVGVAVLAFRINISASGLFASIEDLYVRPEARRQGVGRALIEAVGERCRARGVSYVEVQTDNVAAAFYEAAGFEPEEGVRVLSASYEL